MKRMYMLDGLSHVTFQNPTDAGYQTLKTLRESMPEVFKFARIKDVLQAFPDKVNFSLIYEKGFRNLDLCKKIVINNDVENKPIQKGNIMAKRMDYSHTCQECGCDFKGFIKQHTCWRCIDIFVSWFPFKKKNNA